ncbi:CHASE domain-containing protein [Sulfitobacter sp. F26169L]|uniref:CHASE domain-containing protein n=1 Tax=Sulfitobacter sp. F26169L TaxID=2996015 RepID=UPI00226094A4|nr:CHASE domain-containing protein [Sulfitobacter sp. F26169L]MCX7566483.1 CHASE domain-containing protein [Sulfitobacter sp. F26169L]
MDLNHHTRKGAQEFEAITKESFDVLDARLRTYLLSIKGTAAFVAASREVTKSDFRVYVDGLNIPEQLPSITGIGLIEEVPEADINEFLRRMRLEVDPDFSIRRRSAENVHHVIKYMEPEDNNAEAIGLDVTFAANRAAVMREAKATGEPRLTPPIYLVQSDASRAGYVLFMPIYRTTLESEKRGPFLGWINAAFVAQDMFSNLTSTHGQSYGFRAFDGKPAEGSAPLYEEVGATVSQAKFTEVYQIERFGRNWTLEFYSTPKFEAALRTYQPLSILIAGLTLTAMLISILRNTRQRTQNLKKVSELKSRQIIAQEQETRSIVENDVTSVFLLDASDRILFANQAAQNCFGRSAEELYMAPLSSIATPARPSDGSFNAKGITRSGSQLELDLHRNEWTSSEGDKRSTVILRDLTSQNADRRSLNQSKALFDMALQGSEIGVFDIDLTTGKSEVSDTWCRIMGYDQRCNGLDTQRSFIERIHPDDIGILEQADADCIAGKTVRSTTEYRLRTKDGSWCWMRSDAVVAERDEQGKALRLIGTQIDITELRHDRNALENSEKLFRQIIQHAPIGMALMDDGGNFINVNSAFSDLAGRSEADLMSSARLSDMIPNTERKSIYSAISTMMSNNDQSVYSAEHQIIMPSGEKRWGLLSISWSFDKNQNRYFFIGQIIDITDQKKIDLMKDEFVSTVSHELRTPLTSIKGALGLLLAGKTAALTPAQSRLIDIAKSNADRLTDIVNDILDLEKISAGEVTFNTTELDLAEIIEVSVQQMSPFATTHNSTIRVDIPEARLPVCADYGRTQQVLANLISNACKYSDADSEVVVKAEQIDDEIIVYVQNSGPGVPDSFRSKIFKPFSQADGSDTRTTGGTGLGLNISKQIVQRQGGKIGFESIADVVTIFWFTIPVSDYATVVAHKEASKPRSIERENLKILHVEDDHDFAEILAASLEDFADLRHASSLATAQKFITGEPLDIVILDWTLPDGDARSLIAQIAQLQPKAKIIGLSANGNRSNDPRLFADIVKSRAEMATVVASINKCRQLAS